VNDKPARSDETSQPDETPVEQEPGESTPATWDRHQVETDDAGEPRERDAETLVPGWNKGEMAEERADHTRSPLTPPDELDEPDGGLSGHGSNPGGGERWAERDRER
jgi:hypothetical protein